MEQQLSLDDIMLQPSTLNSGCHRESYNFGVIDPSTNTATLPIFTSPMDSVIRKENWKVWSNVGINPVLPRTENLDIRLEGCQYIFTAFSLKEIKQNFIEKMPKNIQGQLKLCIDCGNGHDVEIFNQATQLRKIYGPKVNIMAGNIGNEKTYIEYCRADIDYVRVGISCGSLVDTSKFGFHSPLASLLMNIKGVKSSCTGFKLTKIIADGGINSHADILKAIALGADYVMIGRQFVKLVEAAGEIYQKTLTTEGKNFLDIVSPDILKDEKPENYKDLNLQRLYCGNTSLDMQARRDGYDTVHDWKGAIKPCDSTTEWVSITSNLESWLSTMYDVFSYGFTMSGATNWDEFRKNIKYCRA